MEWTNYHHLLYFYTAVKEGGVNKAAKKLHVSQPTVSKQINSLEQSLNEPLWVKDGRGHKLTESGEIAYQYAEEIFSLGSEMRDTLKGGLMRKDKSFSLGLNQALPKLLAARIISNLMKAHQKMTLKCVEGSLETLISDLKDHHIDAILSDAPTQTNVMNMGYNHLLLESEIGLYATAKLSRKYKHELLQTIQKIPLILPTYPSALRKAFDDWCYKQEIEINIVSECDDSGLMKALGAEGQGAFIAPISVDKEVTSQYKVKNLGILPGVYERIWLISPARKIVHPVIKELVKTKSISGI